MKSLFAVILILAAIFSFSICYCEDSNIGPQDGTFYGFVKSVDVARRTITIMSGKFEVTFTISKYTTIYNDTFRLTLSRGLDISDIKVGNVVYGQYVTGETPPHVTTIKILNESGAS